MRQLAPQESVTVSGGVIVRQYRIPAGSHLVTHKHPYDHLSILLSGEAILTKNGVTSTLKGPRMIEIEAGIEHGICAVTDCTWDCLHSLTLAKSAAKDGDPHVMEGLG